LLAGKPARRKVYWFRASATFEVAPTRAATAWRRGGETRVRAAAKSTSGAGEGPCSCTGVWPARAVSAWPLARRPRLHVRSVARA